MAGDPTADLARMTAAREHFSKEGYLQWDGLITAEEVLYLKEVYDKMLGGAYAEVAKHRYDLGEGDPSPKKTAGVEKITQIMWPSDILPALRDHPMRARALALARGLYEDDSFEFDFDMLINKAPQTDTPTPAHQDQSYWPELTDKRAVSVWVALDDSTVENGCMWYGPRTHLQPLRAHYKSGPATNAALQCDASEAEMVPMPLTAGGAGLHAGRTLHYSRGNKTDGPRRAYILNFRPRAAIEQEREKGFDHGRAGHVATAVRTAKDDSDAAAHVGGALLGDAHPSTPV